MFEVTMPKLGETDAHSFTIEKWLVRQGQRIRKGHPLLVVATDKTSIEVESRAGGVVRLLLGSEGSEVAVGAVIALIGHSRDKIPAAYSKATAARSRAPVLQEAPAESAERRPNLLPSAPVILPREGNPPISPRARRRLKEFGLPLQAISLPPEGRRITERDVLAVAARMNTQTQSESAAQMGSAAPKAQLESAAAIDISVAQDTAPPQVQKMARVAAERTPLSSLRRTIAESMAYSQQWIPQFSIDMFVESEPLLALRRNLQEQWGKKLAPRVDDFFILALARLLDQEKFRAFRAVIDGNDLVVRGRINIGFAVSLGDRGDGDNGVLVPVVRNADRLSLQKLVPVTQDLVARARLRHLKPLEQSGGLMTVSNLGESGVCSFRAIVRPGESAILAIPATQLRPVAPPAGVPAKRPAQNQLGGSVNGVETAPAGFQPAWQLSISVDHRLVDGALAGNFLSGLKSLVEYPTRLL